MYEGGDRRDRGQILLISALLIAVMFVGLAVVVNSAIYTENRATREVTRSAEPLADHPVTQERLSRAIHEVNFESDTAGYEERNRKVTKNVSDWDSEIQSKEATNGNLFGSRVVDRHNGTRISQDEYSDFMPNNRTMLESIVDEDPDPFGLTNRMSWLVANNVQTRSITMTVKRDSLQDVDADLLDQLDDLLDGILDGSTYFWMHFDDGSSEWRVYLVQNSSNEQVISVVTEDDGSGEDVKGACAVEGTKVNVNLDENELVGQDTSTACPSMAFTDQIDRHNVYFAGSDEINGTYSIIADRKESPLRSDVNQEYDDIIGNILSGLDCTLSLVNLDPLCFFDSLDGDEALAPSPTDGDPYTSTAVWNTTVQLTYKDDRVHLTRNVSVPAKS